MNYAEDSLRLHDEWKGKMEVVSLVPVIRPGCGKGRSPGCQRQPEYS